METIVGYRVINGNVFGRNIDSIEEAFFSSDLESTFNILKSNDEYDMLEENRISKQLLIVATINEWRVPSEEEKFGWSDETDIGEVINLNAIIKETLLADDAYDFLIKQLSDAFVLKNSDFLKQRAKFKKTHKIKLIKHSIENIFNTYKRTF